MYLPEIGNIPQKYKKQIRTVKSALEHFFPIRFPKTCFFRNKSFFSNLRMYRVYIYIYIYICNIELDNGAYKPTYNWSIW